MARFTFKLPDIGEGIAEAEIVAWHVAIGDRVEEDQNIADMMTDKATVEMESPVSGMVVELAGEVGDQVAIGAALVVIETDAAGGSAELTPHVEDEQKVERVEAQYEAENPGVEETVEPKPAAAEPMTYVPSPRERPRGWRGDADAGRAPAVSLASDLKCRRRLLLPLSPASGENRQEGRSTLASPAVRQRAKELGVDLRQVKPDAEGRVRHADLDTYLRYSAGQGYHSPSGTAPRQDEQVRVIGMRRRIAENMAAAKRNIPHFTYVDEIDVTELERVRADLNDSRGSRPKLTLLPFIIAAICKTVPQFPMLNARYDDEAGVVNRSGVVHLGMATQTDAGADGAGDPQRGFAERVAAGDRDHPAGRGGEDRQGDLAGAVRRYADRHLARPARRNRHDAGHQPPGSGDHRPQQGGRAPGLPRRRDRPCQADEPVDQLRPPRGRWLGCGELCPGGQEAARNASAAVHAGVASASGG